MKIEAFSAEKTGAKYILVLDASAGLWQGPLDKHCRSLWPFSPSLGTLWGSFIKKSFSKENMSLEGAMLYSGAWPQVPSIFRNNSGSLCITALAKPRH